MDIQEKTEILLSLQSGLDTLVLSIHGLNEESAKRKPGVEKWSILECMEHIVDLRAMMTTHPVAGQVNCYEMLLIMSVHPIRHTEQIAEIRKI